jgi:tetratricopeptide (TPR) repeat protein
MDDAARIAREGVRYLTIGDLESAMACFDLALSSDPSHTPASLRLIEVCLLRGEHERALEVLARARPNGGTDRCDRRFDFEIAYAKASVLAAQERARGYRGDLVALSSAVEEALALGRASAPDAREEWTGTGESGRSRAGQVSMLEELLAEIQRFMQ